MKMMGHTYWLFLLLLILLAGCARPMADFIAEQSSTTAPAKVILKNTSRNAESYRWELTDGTRSDEESLEHTFVKSGKYGITLYAIKGKKKHSKTKLIEVGIPERCLVELTTDFGKIVIALSDETPLHRDNFLKLVEEGFFDGLLFHRVMNGFMIQGGDPKSKNAGPDDQLGSGGPGYNIPAEFRESLGHVKGALAAARQPDVVNPEKKSSGSQFYLVQGRPVTESDLKRHEARRDMYYSPALKKEYLEKGGTPFLDGEYTVFGQVIAGLDVIDKIAATPTDGDPPNGHSRPLKDVKMSLRVIE